jgi:hypothetical protein
VGLPIHAWYHRSGVSNALPFSSRCQRLIWGGEDRLAVIRLER